jgi:hypothetical protein
MALERNAGDTLVKGSISCKMCGELRVRLSADNGRQISDRACPSGKLTPCRLRQEAVDAG